MCGVARAVEHALVELVGLLDGSLPSCRRSSAPYSRQAPSELQRSRSMIFREVFSFSLYGDAGTIGMSLLSLQTIATPKILS